MKHFISTVMFVLAATMGASVAQANDDVEVSALIYGKSQHFVSCNHSTQGSKRCPKDNGHAFNQTNTGLALQLSKPLNENWDVTLKAGQYKDSYAQPTKLVMAGVRWDGYRSGDFKAYVGADAGWVRGSDIDTYMHGWGVIPVVGVKYKHVALEGMVTNYVAGGWIRISF